ncbi:Crp/Fnr family transcriptional regulator [Rhizobium sp. LCM 4573]|uniref:Crp/Fnr family transcriptional regulator n=1 Tax=Rhizobium sp. LCM 4573 TaxID=1848291 RepID=UPI0008DADB1E|nr:Crp/Fnr family transcriptional regulator [Rhizobium sp. LCM 4573]OHV84787.1 Crp/Fnr family transcriptional regulator [Rhizobium sp. LCM 4573]
MANSISIASSHTSCEQCPIRGLPTFRDFSPEELSFVLRFRQGEHSADPGMAIIVEGENNPRLYTVLTGWGFRYKILEDGRRQILNYVLPGDMIGLQGNLMTEMQHSVEALTPMTLCLFERERLATLYREHPSLAYDITWIAAREESILDEHLLSIGRRSARERAAYLLAFLDLRARTSGIAKLGRPVTLPLTQQHVADTLGLSLVHTNKTLRKLSKLGLIRWLDRGCEVLDMEGLYQMAGWRPPAESRRPFI